MDLILNGAYSPTYEEITEYIEEPGKTLWECFNTYIQESYKAKPKITFSVCSAKPGWNIKYQKSGKSLCTLYPEKERFIALIVIKLDIVSIIESMEEKFTDYIMNITRDAKPFNGTKWLMISVDSKDVLEDVKSILDLKTGL